jgi:hypothetical protein
MGGPIAKLRTSKSNPQDPIRSYFFFSLPHHSASSSSVIAAAKPIPSPLLFPFPYPRHQPISCRATHCRQATRVATEAAKRSFSTPITERESTPHSPRRCNSRLNRCQSIEPLRSNPLLPLSLMAASAQKRSSSSGSATLLSSTLPTFSSRDTPHDDTKAAKVSRRVLFACPCCKLSLKVLPFPPLPLRD